MTRFVTHILALIMCLATTVMTRKVTFPPFASTLPGCPNLSLAGFLLCVLTFNFLIVELGANDQTCKNGNIEPKSPYFWRDEEFQITCKAGRDLTGNLTFTVVHKNNFKTWREVSVGNNSVELTGQLHPNSTQKTFMFMCIEERSQECLSNVYVDFEYRPVKPENLQLKIYNWDNMTLTWDLVQPYVHPHHVNVTCQFQALSSATFRGNGARKFVMCTLINNTACHVNVSNYTDADQYAFQVSIVNINTNDTATTEKEFKRDRHVEPAQLMKLTIKETQSGCLFLRWTSPIRSGLDFLYHISYFSDCGDTKNIYILKKYGSRPKRKVDTTICSLTANANYTFSVRVIVSIDNKTEGYWSKPLVDSVRMAAQVPTMSPVWTKGLYEYISSGIKLYFEPLTKCDLHANSGQYELSNGSSVIANAAATDYYMAVPLPDDNNEQLLYLYTKNDQGVSHSTTNISLSPKLKGLKPSHLLAEQVHSTTNNCRKIFFSIHSNPNNEKDFINLTHTLVYCVGVSICKSQVYWREIDSNATMEDCDGYRFGLITRGYSTAKMDVVATAISWNECVYDRGKVPEALPKESIKREDGQQPGTLKIGWRPGSCQDGYVSHYVLEYCPVEKDCDCSGDIETKVTNGDVTSATLSELKASRVCVSIRANNSAGEGLKVELGPFQITQTDSPWIFVLIISLCVLIAVGLFIIYKFVWPKLKQYRKNLPITDFLADTPVLQLHDMSPEPYVPEPTRLEEIHIDSEETSPFLVDSGHSSLNTDSSHEEARNQSNDDDSAIGSQSTRPAYLYSFTDDRDTSRISETERLNTEMSNRPVGTGDDMSLTDCLEGYEDPDGIIVGDGQELSFSDAFSDHDDDIHVLATETSEHLFYPDVTAKTLSCKPNIEEKYQDNETDTVIHSDFNTANDTVKPSEHNHRVLDTDDSALNAPKQDHKNKETTHAINAFKPNHEDRIADCNTLNAYHKDHCDTSVSKPYDQEPLLLPSAEGSCSIPVEYLSNYDRPTDIDMSNESSEAENLSESADRTVTQQTVMSVTDQDLLIPSEDAGLNEIPQNGDSSDPTTPELTESDEDGHLSDYPDYTSAIQPTDDSKDIHINMSSLGCMDFCKPGLNDTGVDGSILH